MENNEQPLKPFFEENNLMIISDTSEKLLFKMEYDLGEVGKVEIDDIELEGEYISRLISVNDYTIIYTNGMERKISVSMDNPL